MLKKWIGLAIVSFVVLLSGCTATQINFSETPYIEEPATFAVLPFDNHTETPLAGERATAVTASLLAAHGVSGIVVYQRSVTNKTLFPGITKPVSKPFLYSWARRQGAHYAMTGDVNEWTYKVGLDGEPVVGITLNLIDLYTGQIVWTAVGSSSGGSRVAVSTVAQNLINLMINGLFVQYHQ